MSCLKILIQCLSAGIWAEQISQPAFRLRINLCMLSLPNRDVRRFDLSKNVTYDVMTLRITNKSLRHSQSGFFRPHRDSAKNCSFTRNDKIYFRMKQ